MDEPGLRFDAAPSAEAIKLLGERIDAYNIAKTGRGDDAQLAFFYWAGDELAAGIYGWTWAGWLDIKLLWLREDLRGRGLGRRLLFAAEREAQARGCSRVLLDSFSFQAPGFYQKLGYEVFGKLDDCPEGHARYFLTKRLA
jgi:GNAT superfamily N-acetyltransferase